MFQISKAANKQMNEQKTKERKRQSAQDLIPIKRFDSGIFITDDYRIVQPLRVSSLNLGLMSDRELNEVLERYEIFLRSIHFPFQTTIVSQPINLQGYIQEQNELLGRTKNHFKRELLQDYIAYAQTIERNQNMMQRQRYIITFEKIMGVSKMAYNDALHSLTNKVKHLKEGLTEVGLHAEEVTDFELMRYFHSLFDYTGSQYTPVQDDIVKPFMRGEKL